MYRRSLRPGGGPTRAVTSRDVSSKLGGAARYLMSKHVGYGVRTARLTRVRAVVIPVVLACGGPLEEVFVLPVLRLELLRLLVRAMVIGLDCNCGIRL